MKIEKTTLTTARINARVMKRGKNGKLQMRWATTTETVGSIKRMLKQHKGIHFTVYLISTSDVEDLT